MSLKNKRVRTIFTPEQLERLEAEFERQQYMVRKLVTYYSKN
jgi:Homeodomain